MQFRKYITKQSCKQSSQSSPNTFHQYQRSRHQREGSGLAKKEGVYQKNNSVCVNEIEKAGSLYNREDFINGQRKMETNLSKKEQNWLTEEERKIVGDIGKLFSSEASKSTKLLIRINQTQSSKANQSGQKGTFTESRLQKIEVTRLDSHNIESTLLKGKHDDGLFFDKQNENDRQGQTQPNLQSSLRSAKSFIQVCHSPSQSSLIEPMLPMLPGLSITKQISIMFVPSQLTNRNSPFYFSKFNKKNNEQINSNYSHDFHEDKDSKKDHPEGSNYVKLLEIQLFLRKQEIRHQRSQELRHANEKLLSTHLFSKQELQKAKAYIQSLQIGFKNRFEELKGQLEQEKQQNKQLTQHLQAKQKTIHNLNKLNQQFLKENNQLKETIKQNTKCIRQLKYEISHRQKNTPAEANTKHADINKQKISFLKSDNEYGHPYLPRSPRKEQIPSNVPTYTNDLPTSYTPTQLNQKTYRFYRNDKVDINQAKLANCRSQGVLNPSQSIKRENPIKDIVHHNYQPTSRSHKHVGIRKNNFNQEPISPSTRNLVRINKNSINDGSILIGEKIKDNKSLSNFSQLSGKSLSQRVGYISKPIQEKKSGILVDYMIDSEIRPKQQQKPQKKGERFKFK